MPYNVESRLRYIGTRQNQVRGETVVYSRGAAQVILTQCPGHTDVQDLTPHTIINETHYVDFIIFTRELKLPGIGITLPQRGDTILWRGRLYTVTPPTDTDAEYNYTTMYRDRLRVHTLLTTVATNEPL